MCYVFVSTGQCNHRFCSGDIGQILSGLYSETFTELMLPCDAIWALNSPVLQPEGACLWAPLRRQSDCPTGQSGAPPGAG
jgi:hypothetical protein